jgi:hypothetical protein
VNDISSPESGETVAYPPPPWHLRGQAHGHLFAVARSELPATPTAFKPLIIAGRGLVVAGWVDYQSGSVLSYGELFVAVVGWRGRRLSATVTHMFVDSSASRAGGRELWGYPKELAEFDLHITPAGRAAARDDRGELARGSYRPWLTFPVRIKAAGGTVQPLDGVLTYIQAIFDGKLSLGGGNFTAPPQSSLAFLSGARRLAGFGLADFEFTFGL